MKPILRSSSRYLAVMSAALAMTFGSAYAADAGVPPAGPGAPGAHEMGHHGRGPHMMERLNALHAKLQLNAQQESKWQTALDTMKHNREAQRANRDKMRQQFKAAQQQSILDLDALHSGHQQFERQNAQLREQTAAAWLQAYDSLNDQQKTLVSTELKQHFAKMEARHDRMHRAWEKRRGATGAGDASKPTAP